MSSNFNLPQPNKSDCWATPSEIINKIGISHLDPCGYKHPEKGILTKTAENYFFIEDDGLSKEWDYESVFVNFPYSESKKWMDKCSEEYKKYKCQIIVLCFARVETRAIQNNLNFATGINLINKRIKFIDSDGNIKGNGNAPSMLIAYGESAYNRIKNIQGIYCRVDK